MKTTNQREPIFSTLGGDADLGELVEMYVDEMPDRIEAFDKAFFNADWETLRQLAHQMKGAGQSYGFDLLTPLAADVEYALRDDKPKETVQQLLNELTETCGRICAGVPDENRPS